MGGARADKLQCQRCPRPGRENEAMPALRYLTCPRLAARSACADEAAAQAVPAVASRRRGDARTLLFDVPLLRMDTGTD